MKRPIAILLFITLSVWATIAGCRNGGGHDDAVRTESVELQSARTVWSGRSFQSYTYEIFYSCFCAFGNERVRVNVENNIVVSATHVETGEPIAEAAQVFLTIDGLFDQLEQALAGDPQTYRAQFDPTTGVPIHAEVDPEAGFADDEYSWDLSLVNPAAQSCGPVQCPGGTECCNASCGICVPPGGACIQVFCEN